MASKQRANSKGKKGGKVTRPAQKSRNTRKGKFSLGVQSSLFDAQMEYSKVRAPQSLGTRMKFGGQTSRSVGGNEVISGTSVLFSVGAVDGTTSVTINPGLAALFPQASPACSVFSQYCFDKLSIRYVPTVPSTTPGRVVMVFNNNAVDEPPLSFTAAASYENAVGFNVWDDGVRLECADRLLRYVRVGPNPNGTDLKTYDAGLLSVLVENTSSELQYLGDIVADYVITLQDRILQPPIGCEIIPATTCTLSEPFNFAETEAYNPMAQFELGPADPGDPEAVDILYMSLPPGYWLLQNFLTPNGADVADWIGDGYADEQPYVIQSVSSLVNVGFADILGVTGPSPGGDVTICRWFNGTTTSDPTQGGSYSSYTAYIPESGSDVMTSEFSLQITRNEAASIWGLVGAVKSAWMFCRLTPTISTALSLPGSSSAGPLLRRPVKKFIPRRRAVIRRTPLAKEVLVVDSLEQLAKAVKRLPEPAKRGCRFSISRN